MIPSIETIVEDVAMGRITKSQAVMWLYAHAEGAVNDFRDQFAAAALPEMIRSAREEGHQNWGVVAGQAYLIANAMIEAGKMK